MKWLDSLEKRLDSLEKWLDSKLLGSMEVEADLGRRRLVTGLAVNLITFVSIFVVGYGARHLLGSNGLAIAVVIGYAVVYGVVAYLIYRYIGRWRRDSPTPEPPAPPSPDQSTSA